MYVCVVIIYYFEGEFQNGGPLFPLAAERDRVALQLSFSMVNHIAARHNRDEILSSPPKKRDRKKHVVTNDAFDQTAIQNVIYEMYRNNPDIFNGGTSLWKVLENIAFKYKKDDPDVWFNGVSTYCSETCTSST